MASVLDHDAFRQWIKGIPYEVAFWNSYYRISKRREDLFSWSQYGKPCHVDNFDIDEYFDKIECDLDDALILDVGCALSYVFSNLIKGRKVNIKYVDPLAMFYNNILERHKIDRPRIDFGMIECLSIFFKKDSVQFIHIRNALDHCADPYSGLLQSLHCLKQGGILYLRHHRNIAEIENYRGFHKFNVDEHADHLILWNQACRLDITELVAPFASISTSIAPDGDIIAVAAKCNPIPENVVDPCDSARAAADMTADIIRYFNSASGCIEYQSLRLLATIGHAVTKLLPYSLVDRLRALLAHR